MEAGARPQRSARLDAAFAQEVEHGLTLAARVRLVVLAVVGAWVTFENPYPEFLYFYPYFLLFALFGYLPLLARSDGRPIVWVRYLCLLLDMGLFTLLVMLPNPLDPDVLPPQLRLRFGNEIYLFAFIVASAFTYSPALVMWSGVCAATTWSLATLAVVLLPDTVASMPSSGAHADAVRRAVDPHTVFLNVWGRQVVVFLVTAGSLATLVQRARRLVERQTSAERERANLSRYFSPNMVDELAQADQPLGPTQQQVAVLFVDMIGFTRLAESLAPPAVIALLREFHGRMQAAVFAHHGTVDKYIGDGVMATFGTPRTGAHDASNALRAARAMCEAMTAWNLSRTARGEAPVAIGVGVHYGTVVLGDIGGESRLEFAVLGDTVNVASRLERLTREIGATIVASDAVVATARTEDGDVESVLAGFAPGPPQTLRGRVGVVGIWVA